MDINKIQDDLNSVMKEVGKAKTNLSKLEGQEEEILRQLKDTLKLNSEADAEKEIKRIDKLLVSVTEKIETDYRVLKDNYAW